MNRSEWKQTRPGVFYTAASIVTVNREHIRRLKKESRRTGLASARLCLHRDEREAIQQMLIAHRRDGYVRPHCHPSNIEAFHVIEGRMIVFRFDDRGAPVRRIPMGPAGGGGTFFCRMPEGLWHGMVPVTEEVVFLETTEGPFDALRHTVYADWAPAREDAAAAAVYIDNLMKSAG